MNAHEKTDPGRQKNAPWGKPAIRNPQSAIAAWVILLAAAPRSPAQHPFIPWTAEEAAAIRKRVSSEPWAKAACEAMCKPDRRRGGDAAVVANLFRYSVMGEKAPGEAEKKALLAGGRVREHVEALRYDVLYDLLSGAERAAVERRFRSAVESAIAGRSRGPKNRYNWLPNLGYPWMAGRQLLAVALRDKELVGRIFHCDFGWAWYIGKYLSDTGLYNEEFGKSNWAPPLLLLYCRGARRMGADELGFGYVAEGSRATAFGMVHAYIDIAYPKVTLYTGSDHWPTVTMGDAKNQARRILPGYPWQQCNFVGCLTDGAGGGAERSYGGMFDLPFWFEMAHAQWPKAGFDYFLAQMRGPKDERYYPSLLFGLEPIDPKAVKPPPAPSQVFPQRGLAVLRADESPAYWTGPAPAVAMRMATPYAHHVQDSFSICGLYAFNRPIYVNHVNSTNYTGVDPGWSNSMRAHMGVIVDSATPKTVGELPSRHDFAPEAKFFACRGKGIYDGVDQTRALVLTRDYLLDAFALASDRPRSYLWLAHTFGRACADEPNRWAPSADLRGPVPDLAGEESCATDGDWAVTATQYTLGAHPKYGGLGKAFFDRRVGVRMTMLGEAGTTAYTAWTPVLHDWRGRWMARERFAYGAEEPAGVTFAAQRRKAATCFVALHEPFDGAPRIAEVRLIQRTDNAVGVAIRGQAGSGIDDRVLIAFGDAADKPTTLSDGRETFTFTGYAFVRFGTGRLVARGSLQDMKLPDRAARAAPKAPGRIAAFWQPATAVRVPTGGSATAKLTLRNVGFAPVTAKIAVETSEGVACEPQAIEVSDFAPGAERAVVVKFRPHLCAPPLFANNRLYTVRLVGPAGGAEVQPAELKVAVGVCRERELLGLGEWRSTIYAPRYLARYYYMDSGGATVLLDPAGQRRTPSSSMTYPMVVLPAGKDARGNAAWSRAERVPKFPYFVPVLVHPADANDPAPSGVPGQAYVYEAGRHAHGSRSDAEQWFCEDWMLFRWKAGKADERIIFDWLPREGNDQPGLCHPGVKDGLAAADKPGKLIVVGAKGAAYEGKCDDWPRGVRIGADAGDIVDVFRRPAGTDHGELMLYPPGSQWAGGGVAQIADRAMGFTYCTEAELGDLLARWRRLPEKVEPSPEAAGTYSGAFMPHLER